MHASIWVYSGLTDDIAEKSMTDTDKEYIEIDVREPLQARIEKLFG